MKIVCIGSGAFSYGITKMLKKNNHDITMWTHDINLKNDILKEVGDIVVTDDLSCIENAHAIFILVSTPFFRETVTKMIPYLNINTKIYIGTKGLMEDGTTLEQWLESMVQNEVIYFSGPNLAKDLDTTYPIGISLSKKDLLFSRIMPSFVSLDFQNAYLPYLACYKNIIAILAGFVFSYANNSSTLYTILTYALKELEKAFKINFICYGGIGDYFMTTTLSSSRNYTYGTLLAKDKNEAKKYLENNTVEGYQALPYFLNYLKKEGLSIPILSNLYDFINDKIEKEDFIFSLK